MSARGELSETRGESFLFRLIFSSSNDLIVVIDASTVLDLTVSLFIRIGNCTFVDRCQSQYLKLTRSYVNKN